MSLKTRDAKTGERLDADPEAQKLDRAAQRWDRNVRRPRTFTGKWFRYPPILRHHNMRICGEPLPGQADGMNLLLRRALGGRVLDRAISVGAGNGMRELEILRLGLVRHFELWDVSPESCRQARENADSMGFGDRVTIHLSGGAFEERDRPEFDLVHWNMSLHHMPSTEAAVRWSRQVLKPGGYFYALEMAGPNHYQWTDEMMAEANRAIGRVPRHWLKHWAPDPPKVPEYREPRVALIPLERMLRRDPTECQDSERIEPSIRAVFPGAEITRIGGVIYYIGLDGCFWCLTEEDEPLLAEFLAEDAALADRGLWLYLACLARKTGASGAAQGVSSGTRRRLARWFRPFRG